MSWIPYFFRIFLLISTFRWPGHQEVFHSTTTTQIALFTLTLLNRLLMHEGISDFANIERWTFVLILFKKKVFRGIDDSSHLSYAFDPANRGGIILDIDLLKILLTSWQSRWGLNFYLWKWRTPINFLCCSKKLVNKNIVPLNYAWERYSSFQPKYPVFIKFYYSWFWQFNCSALEEVCSTCKVTVAISTLENACTGKLKSFER